MNETSETNIDIVLEPEKKEEVIEKD